MKINELLKVWPKGTLAVQAWLEKHHIYRQLAMRYCHTDWLVKMDHGVYSRSGDKVEWKGGLYALQQELSLKIHVGAQSALEMQGLGQYVAMGGGNVWLFVAAEEKRIPSWFKRLFNNKTKFHYAKTNLFRLLVKF